MVFGHRQIDARLNDRVEDFRQPDSTDSKIEDSKILGGDMEQDASDGYQDSDAEMDTHIALCAQGVPESMEGVTKAGDKFCEFSCACLARCGYLVHCSAFLCEIGQDLCLQAYHLVIPRFRLVVVADQVQDTVAE